MSSPTIDLREVDSPFVKREWIQNIIKRCDKGEIITYECQDKDHYKCPEGIPNHSCVKERVSSCGYSHKESEDRYKCPSGIHWKDSCEGRCKEKQIVTPEPSFTHAGIVTKLPHQYCPSEKEYGKLPYENPDEIVKVYMRGDPHNVFLAKRSEIIKENKKFHFPEYIIQGSPYNNETNNIMEGRHIIYPHPSNHDW